MSNFNYWYDNVADMPTKAEDGQWYDAETGFPYNPNHNYKTGKAATKRKPLSDKAQDARDLAKFYGGRALKGTARQKEWAEKIRAEKLQQMEPGLAELAVDPNGLLTHSKFWIEHRSFPGGAISEFVQQQKSLLKQYNAARGEMDHDKVKALAEQYNELTSRWGF